MARAWKTTLVGPAFVAVAIACAVPATAADAVKSAAESASKAAAKSQLKADAPAADAAASAVEKSIPVAIRVVGGRFLRAGEDGALVADRLYPLESERFDLLSLKGGAVALRSPRGRLLAAQPPDARRLLAASPRAEPGEWETFTLVGVDGNRVGLKAKGFREFVRFAPGPEKSPAGGKPREKPEPAETIEIFQTAEFPEAFRNLVASTARAIAASEVGQKEYHQNRVRRHETFVKLPAPSSDDLLRTKRQRVASVTDEYEIRAQLDGPLQIEFRRMPYLRGYRERGTARLMFDVRATAPVRGHVRYHVHNVLSASTNFRTAARLALIGELAVAKQDAKLTFASPTALELSVELTHLDFSNDVLQAARKPIEDVINHELRVNHDRIRDQANKALAKALKTRELENPLLRYLAFP
jgi:hypothetical protein